MIGWRRIGQVINWKQLMLPLLSDIKSRNWANMIAPVVNDRGGSDIRNFLNQVSFLCS